MRTLPLILGLIPGIATTLVDAAPPVQNWSFDDGPLTNVQGNVTLDDNGIVGKAARFDGQGSHIDIPDVSYSGGFTVAAWVRLENAINQSDAILGQGGPGMDINFYATRPRLYDGSGDVIASASSVRADQWQHVALTRTSANELRLFVNGELSGTAPWTGTFTAKAIGLGNGAGGLQGLVDELKIYDTELSDAEITALSDFHFEPIRQARLQLLASADVPYLVGASRTAFDPNPTGGADGKSWFTNDHSFVVDHEGTLHWFGINNPYLPNNARLYDYHPFLGHVSTTDPEAGWTRHPHAIDESAGSEYVGAPGVIWHEESNRWAMVVETKIDGARRLEVCWSDDLMTWTRTHTAILPGILWYTTRDPHIIKGEDGKYWIHVVTNGNSESQVIRIKTADFVTFESPEVILGMGDGVPHTLIESPFIHQRKGVWYLFFTHAHKRYTETLVVVSDTPDHFDYHNSTLTTLFGHAAKVFTYKGKTYISSCGPEDFTASNDHALTLAGLDWAIRSAPADTDGDGLSDDEESSGIDDPAGTPAHDPRGHVTDPNHPDSDRDGTPDGAEARLGTNPLSSAESFKATIGATPAGQPMLSWPSDSGTAFTLQRSDNLETWDDLITGLPGAPGSTSFTDTTAAPVAPRLFYRIALEPVAL